MHDSGNSHPTHFRKSNSFQSLLSLVALPIISDDMSLYMWNDGLCQSMINFFYMYFFTTFIYVLVERYLFTYVLFKKNISRIFMCDCKVGQINSLCVFFPLFYP